MIGVLDSGVGGLASFRELRARLPEADLVYLADRQNAPYGTKTQRELVDLVTRDIDALRSLGAERVLIACCTASTVYGELPPEHRRIALPIIRPAAIEAVSAGRRIAVIATEHTVSSHAFRREISLISDSVEVKELAAQPLVALVEQGSRDGHCTDGCRAFLDRMTAELSDFTPDVLILGCTHFSHLEHELASRLGGTAVISPARVGALELIRGDPVGSQETKERGRSIYTEGRKQKKKGRTKCQSIEEAGSTTPLQRSSQ